MPAMTVYALTRALFMLALPPTTRMEWFPKKRVCGSYKLP
jgi:hypothetical protein